MTQATAKREAARRHVALRAAGLPSTFHGGVMWSLPKRQFQALYACVGSYEEALALRPEMLPWPPDRDGVEFPTPPDHVIYSWARAIDAGEDQVDPKLEKIMEMRLHRRFKAEMRKGMVVSSKALQHLAGKVIDGTIDPKQQSQILSLGQAVNYGMGNYAQFHKALEGNQPGGGLTQIGRLVINAPGQQQRQRQQQKVKSKVIEATATEVTE
jgi:hypothetical protein